MNPRKIFYSQGHQTSESSVCHLALKNITVFECSGLFLYNFHKCLNIHVIHKGNIICNRSNALFSFSFFFFLFWFLVIHYFFQPFSLQKNHIPYKYILRHSFHSFYIFDISAKPAKKSDRRILKNVKLHLIFLIMSTNNREEKGSLLKYKPQTSHQWDIKPNKNTSLKSLWLHRLRKRCTTEVWRGRLLDAQVPSRKQAFRVTRKGTNRIIRV